MCGIVGAWAFNGHDFEVTAPYIVRMRDAVRHRGPDGAGVWISPDGRVGLGHRRLSILDLSPAASQPMANEDGSLQVVFNGEIYNHAEIRAELERLGGHTWRTSHSDTEVILHAFEEWGIKCLERFRGTAARLEDFTRRALPHPLLVIADGAPGLIRAAETCFPRALRQRRLVHRLRNLRSRAPERQWSEIAVWARACYEAASPALATWLRNHLVQAYARR